MRRTALFLLLLATGSAAAQDPPPAAEKPAGIGFKLPKGRRLVALAASPDGKWVATWSGWHTKDGALSGGQIDLFPAAGGAPTSVSAPERADLLAFTSDGRWVVSADSQGREVQARQTDALSKRVELDVSKANGKAAARRMMFSRIVPFGGPRAVIVGFARDDSDMRKAESQLRAVLDFDAGKRVDDLPARGGDSDWCPAPGGDTVAVTGERDVQLRRSSGEAVWTVRTSGYCRGTVFSRDGATLATFDPVRRRTLFLRARDGETLGETEARLYIGAICAVPVGQATFVFPDDKGVRFLRSDASTCHLEPLTDGGASRMAPFSDGRGVWAATCREDGRDLWTIHRVPAPAEALGEPVGTDRPK